MPYHKSVEQDIHLVSASSTTFVEATAMSKTSQKDARKALDRLDALKSHLSGVKAPTGRLSKLSRSLQGRVAIVTGAASGMGRETAKVFADEGVRVAVLDLKEHEVKAVVDEINAVHPGRAKGWVCDVADRGRVKQVCKEIIEAFGGLDVRCAPLTSRTSCLTQEQTDPYKQCWYLCRGRRLRRRYVIRDSLGQNR